MRTAYSFKTSSGTTEDYIERLKQIGWKNAPIIDTASTFGFVSWRDATAKEGMKPVFGIEIAVTDMIQRKKPIVDYFQFIAIDSVAPLFRLLDLATSQFRYEPMITYKQLAELDGVIKVSGYRPQFDHIEPSENLFIGLSVATPKGVIKRAVEKGFSFLARQENRFPKKGQEAVYEAVCGIKASIQSYPQYVLSDDEYKTYLMNRTDEYIIDSALSNRDNAYDSSNANLPEGNLISIPQNKSLRELCEDGAQKIGIDISSGAYKERLDYELSIIEARKFEDYFFLVGDLMRHTREQKLCGAGRGSSAGSLVCLFLGITTVDPLKFNLIFERFLSMDRVGELPDCDLDLSNEGRQFAFDYLRSKYGQNHVAQIGSTSLFKEKKIFGDLGKTFKIPKYECDAILVGVEDYAQGDKAGAKAAIKNIFKSDKGQRFIEKYPEMELATSLAAHPSHATRHAAGVIVTERPITDYLGYDHKLEGLHANKEDVEALGHCKIDLLALTQLSVFERALELAGLPLSTFDSMSYEDEKVFAVLNDGKFSGVSQFQGYALKNLTKQVKVTEFEDLVALTSLARPGPLDSGGAARWVDCKNGRATPQYIHPDLEPLLFETKGSVVFQEQTMRIVREIGGLDWPSVTKFRRAISKSKGYEALREFEVVFAEGARSRGWTEEQINKLWDELVTFGKYGFPRAHAVAYAINSYQSMWLKAYYPKEYAAATLQFQSDIEKQKEILREMAEEGVSYVAYDPELSSDKWTVVNGNLIGPLQNIKGIATKTVMTILGCRARGEPLPDSLKKKLANATTSLDSLSPIRDRIQTLNWKAHTIGKVTRLDQAKPGEGWDEFQVIGLVTKAEEQSENDERKVADRISRGQIGRLEGDPKSIQVRLKSDEVSDFLCKVTTKQLDKHRDYVLNNLEVGKSLVVVRGKFPPSIPCLLINEIEEIGRME